VSIEARVAGLLREIRHVHNLHRPVNSVPDEILAAIIEMASAADRSNYEDISDLDWNRKGLKVVMSVCRRWRHIALDDAFLWTRIKLNWEEPNALERTRTSLARSKGALISVWMFLPPSNQGAAVELTQLISIPTVWLRTFQGF
jgi:hypothetical protein